MKERTMFINEERVVEMILRACQTVTERGISIKSGAWGVKAGLDGWGSPQNECCPLGAVLLAEQPDSTLDADETVAEVLGVSVGWVNEFVCGVDGDELASSSVAKLGATVIAKASARDWVPVPLVPERVDVEPTAVWEALDSIYKGGVR